MGFAEYVRYDISIVFFGWKKYHAEEIERLLMSRFVVMLEYASGS